MKLMISIAFLDIITFKPVLFYMFSYNVHVILFLLCQIQRVTTWRWMGRRTNAVVGRTSTFDSLDSRCPERYILLYWSLFLFTVDTLACKSSLFTTKFSYWSKTCQGIVEEIKGLYGWSQLMAFAWWQVRHLIIHVNLQEWKRGGFRTQKR